MTEIGDSAFYGCSGELIINSNSLAAEAHTYSNGWLAGSKFTSLIIGNSVTSIGDYAFEGCESLASVTIGNGVTSIGNCAFRDCSSLASVYCKPITPPTGNSFMFYLNASERTIYVPTESVEAYKSAKYWSDYASDIVGYNF